MPFVKLDTGILNSTLWVEKECRDVFITALLMAEPFEVLEPVEQIEVRSLDTTGFLVPPGWYGMVRAAGVGILRHACIEQEAGMNALDRLGLPDPESRSREFEGRRLVRINGGFIVLNFMQYRDRDYTAGTRQKNLRERQRLGIDSLLKQQEYKCGCCGDVFEKPYSKYVVQDHDHSTSKNRALLCQSCNRVVGALENQKPVHSVKAQECTAYLSRYGVTLRNASNVHRNITQAEAEAEAEAERSKPRAQDTGPVPEDSDVRVSAILDAYPKRDFSQAAQNAVINAIAREERKIEANVEGVTRATKACDYLLSRTQVYASAVKGWPKGERKYAYACIRFFEGSFYLQDPEFWSGKGDGDDRPAPALESGSDRMKREGRT